MREASAGLISLLLSRQPVWQVDLFTFTLLGGEVIQLCTGDTQVNYPPTQWLPASQSNFSVERSKWSIKNTLDVPTLDIKLISTGTDYASGTINIKRFLHNGAFDGGTVKFQRACMQVIDGAYGDTTLGVIDIFEGQIGQVVVDSLGATITVRGANVKMNQFMPRNIFMSSCLHTLFDAGCTLLKANYTYYANTTTASGYFLNWATEPTGGDYPQFLFGEVNIIDGLGAGQKRTIVGVGSAGIKVGYPFYVVPQAGDLFTVTFGCDKTKGAGGCNFHLYNNQQHYRGFQFVPPAETAILA